MAKSKLVKGKTSSGFEYSISKKMLQNVEFLELFAAVQGGDSLKSYAMIEVALGKEQKKALYDHVRDEDGFVMADALSGELTEIFEELGENAETKN